MKLRQQVQAPACTDCHSLVDPPGIAFEHFTGDGRYRSTLGMQEVDTLGFFTHDFVANFGRGQTAFKFVGVNDYVGELAASEDVQICLVKKVAAYARLHAADAADATDFECLLRGYPGLAGASVAEAMRVLFSTLFIVGSASD